jgi:putative endonuclease
MTGRPGYVYIMANPANTVVYTGVTSDLKRRVWQHREKTMDGFTRRYNVVKLVYYEVADDITSAIAREKQIKGGSRQDKEALVNSINPDWRDLYNDI